LAEVIEQELEMSVGGEAVRRALHELEFAWRRSRPVMD
jgi:transposase